MQSKTIKGAWQALRKNLKKLESANNVRRIRKILLNNFTQDVAIPVLLVFLLVVLSNPAGVYIPPIIIGVAVIVLVIAFASSVFFYWNEHPKENFKKTRASYFSDKAALFAVATVLIAGTVIQSLLNVLDIWLALALAALVAGKVWGRLYSETKEKPES